MISVLRFRFFVKLIALGTLLSPCFARQPASDQDQQPMQPANQEAQPASRSPSGQAAQPVSPQSQQVSPGQGGELSMPAGPSNSLRLSYFRVQGNANSTLDQAATILGAVNCDSAVVHNLLIHNRYKQTR
jgi:hemolysin activation/secretion protein